MLRTRGERLAVSWVKKYQVQTLSTAVLSINTHDVSVSAEDQHILKEERGETGQFSSHHQALKKNQQKNKNHPTHMAGNRQSGRGAQSSRYSATGAPCSEPLVHLSPPSLRLSPSQCCSSSSWAGPCSGVSSWAWGSAWACGCSWGGLGGGAGAGGRCGTMIWCWRCR